MRRPLLACALLLSILSPPLGCATTEGDADKPTKDGATKDTPKAAGEEDAAKDDAKSAAEADPPPGVKVKGNLPVKTESELAAEDAARDKCVADCVASKQMEARSADAIETDCLGQCMAEHPITQVEVVPDGPPI